MFTTTSIHSSTRTPALAPVGVDSDLGLVDAGFNNDSETATMHSPSHELNDGQSGPLPPLGGEEGEDPSEINTNVAPPDISQEDNAAESDEEGRGAMMTLYTVLATRLGARTRLCLDYYIMHIGAPLAYLRVPSARRI